MEPTKAKILKNLDEFALGYLECALWSSYDDNGGEGPEVYFDRFPFSDISKSSLVQMIQECKAFQEENKTLLDLAEDRDPYNLARAGHDFWLTRNHHGAGFWDRKELEAGGLGEALTVAAEKAKERNLFRQKGLIHQEQG